MNTSNLIPSNKVAIIVKKINPATVETIFKFSKFCISFNCFVKKIAKGKNANLK